MAVGQRQFLHLILLVPEETQLPLSFLETGGAQAPGSLRFLPPLALCSHFLLSATPAEERCELPDVKGALRKGKQRFLRKWQKLPSNCLILIDLMSYSGHEYQVPTLPMKNILDVPHNS